MSRMDFQNSCTPVVPTPLLRVPIQERPSQVSSYLEPHGWLAQVGSVAWFLSCGPVQVELSHPRWRLGSWGAVLDIWLDICRGLSSPWGLREALGPRPAWCLADSPGSRLAPSWTPRTRLGSGDHGPSCWTGHPPTPIRQLHPGPAHRPRGGLGGPVDGCRFPFLSGPHSLGCLRGLSLWRPKEESSMN